MRGTTAGIRAGVAASLSGQFATQGRQALAGLTAWVDWVNGNGGLSLAGRRHPVALRHYDDGSLADGARRTTERLIRQDGVDLLFGPYSAGLTTAAAEVAEQHGRLLWNHGGAGDAIYRRGYRGVVGILTPADRYLSGVPALARRAAPFARTLAVARVASGAFARMVAEGAQRAAAALGFTTVLYREYPAAQTDFADLAASIATVEPDVLVSVGRIRHDIALAGTLAEQPGRGRIGLAVTVATPIAEFADALGTAADGWVGPSQWEPATAVAQPDFGPSGADATAMLRRAARQFGRAADYPMAQALAAGLVAQRCAMAAQSPDDGALRESAGRLDFTTCYGRFRIDDAGRQVGRTVALVQRQDGVKVIVGPGELATGALRWRFGGVGGGDGGG